MSDFVGRRGYMTTLEAELDRVRQTGRGAPGAGVHLPYASRRAFRGAAVRGRVLDEEGRRGGGSRRGGGEGAPQPRRVRGFDQMAGEDTLRRSRPRAHRGATRRGPRTRRRYRPGGRLQGGIRRARQRSRRGPRSRRPAGSLEAVIPHLLRAFGRIRTPRDFPLLGERSSRVAIREYVGRSVRHSGVSLLSGPPWYTIVTL